MFSQYVVMDYSPSLRQGRAWCHTFPATIDQAGEARRHLAVLLKGSPLADDALLCLSEIATNALQHSNSAKPGGIFTVRARLHNQRLRVEVEDQGGPWKPAPATNGLRGRGLLIVGSLASAWGITGDGATARTVWFQMECA